MKYLRNEGSLQAGFWRCKVSEQPEVWEGEFEGDETILVLRGRVRIGVVDGPVVELGPGDSASFLKGTVGRWQILEDYEQFFVYQDIGG